MDLGLFRIRGYLDLDFFKNKGAIFNKGTTCKVTLCLDDLKMSTNKKNNDIQSESGYLSSNTALDFNLPYGLDDSLPHLENDSMATPNRN